MAPDGTPPCPPRSGGLTLARSFYFLYYAALASLSPFLVLHYQHLGLSGRQIGVLTGIPPALFLVGASAWGSLADATRQHRLVLVAAIAGAMASSLLLARGETFLALVPAVAAFALFGAPIVPLVDHAVLELLGPERDRYGRVRLWGALGWGAAGPVVGWLTQEYGLRWSFTGYLVAMLGCLGVGLALPVSQARLERPFRHGLRQLLANRQWLLFLLLAFAGGMGMASVHHYLFLYLEGLGASRSLMGLALTCAMVSELVVFRFSDRLLRRFDLRWLLILCMAITAGRLFAYSVATAPWQALLLQLLHGPTFAVMWVAGVSSANRFAPPGLGATAQGLFSGVNFGLGGAAGALVGGVLYQAVGAAGMFRWAAVWVLAATLAYALATRGAAAAVENDRDGDRP